jgi:glycosyltransferase involved in cell wall biosynthesis
LYRVLTINWRDIKNPEAGGAEVHLHEICKRFVARGHKVTLLASAFEGSLPEENLDGVRVVRRGGKFTFNYHVPRAAGRLLKNQPFDIVVDDINKIPFFTPLYIRKPILALAHHLFGGTIFLETALPLALYVYVSEALIPGIYRRTPFVVVSESTKADLIQRGIPESNIEVVYNAVDHATYGPSDSPKPEEPLIGYVGRIKRYKRIDYLLHAMKLVLRRLPQARLIVAGSGDHLDALVELAGRLGIAERVEFLGYVSEEDKIRMLRRVQVVVNPSSKEGWGVTVIESNACGTPVIASDVPGLKDAVVDGKTGLLVTYGDVEAFAERIVEVLKDEPLRMKLSQEAIAWARRFNWDDSADAILDVIGRLIRKS